MGETKADQTAELSAARAGQTWQPEPRQWSRLLTVRRTDRPEAPSFSCDGWSHLHEMLGKPGRYFFPSARYRVWAASGQRLAEIVIGQDGRWAIYSGKKEQ